MSFSSEDLLSPDQPTISIVIPVHNGGENFRSCLASLAAYVPFSTEIIVVVDGGTDDSWHLAQEFGAKVFKLPTAGGPARARNLGARSAQGDILFFMDADVTIAPNTLSQIAIAFRNQPDLAALIGSYDDQPGDAHFLSQYKNLFHHYTHQMGCEEASTFWGACGAIRRDVFLTIGGFDEAYRYPSVEDIDLGYRLKRASYRIQLCKTVQVKHLKRWGVISLLKAEVFYRALPWTELIWRDRQFVNDLNLKTADRVSLLMTYSLLVALAASCWWVSAWLVVGALSFALIWLNLPVYRFFQRKRGLWFAIRVIPWHWLYFLYGGFAFAIGTCRYYLLSKHKMARASLSQV
ncbi:MAG: glycosyltransferase [Cyanobacteria bacterium CRU_2_1]|nr:glycosyltransferase [Cyanobacteria bacterium RU_5_0]NJR57424.1 glycosyltransferase [Cyanobacteria bacterium CRU_2_1]